jgi:hypothetical protein
MSVSLLVELRKSKLRCAVNRDKRVKFAFFLIAYLLSRTAIETKIAGINLTLRQRLVLTAVDYIAAVPRRLWLTRESHPRLRGIARPQGALRLPLGPAR